MKVLIATLLLGSFCFAKMPEYYNGKKIDGIEVFETKEDGQIAIRWLANSKDKKGPIIIAMGGGHGKWELKDSHITPSRITEIIAKTGDYRAFSLDMPQEIYKKEGEGDNSNESYRVSKNQIDDINTVLLAINKQNSPVYIFTTSKSTLSGINAAASDIPNLKGVIITSVSADLSNLAPLAKIETLWIHHSRDKCFDVGIEKIKKMAALSKNSTFIEFDDEELVSGKACSMTNYHGFFGMDEKLAEVIKRWLENKN